MENPDLAAGGGSGLWPTGVVMLVVITAIVVLVGVRRGHNAKKGTGRQGKQERRSPVPAAGYGAPLLPLARPATSRAGLP